MEAYRRSRVTSSLILNLGRRWRAIVNFTAMRFYPRGKNRRHPLEGWVSPTAVWTIRRDEKSLVAPSLCTVFDIRTPITGKIHEISLYGCLTFPLFSPFHCVFSHRGRYRYTGVNRSHSFTCPASINNSFSHCVSYFNSENL